MARVVGGVVLCSILLSLAGWAGPVDNLRLHPAAHKLSPRLVHALADATLEGRLTVWLTIDTAGLVMPPVELTERAKRRRARVDPSGLLLDRYDRLLPTILLEDIAASGADILYASRWLKAVAVDATPEQVSALLVEPRITFIDRATTLYRTIEDTRAVESRRPAIDPGVYGPSLPQNQIADAVRLHDIGLSGAGVYIGLFDTGFDTTHPAFDFTSIDTTWDFINNQSDVTGDDCPTDSESRRQTYHGTQVFGAVGGFLADTLVGVAYGADYALAKTEITCGGLEVKLEEYNWIAAAEWADVIGVDIISGSLGYTTFQDSGSYSLDDLDGNTALITRAADIAASKNILVVVSAGNSGNDDWHRISFPADGDSVIAVGAIYPDSGLADFSSRGPTADGRIKPDIVTLGVGVVVPRAVGGFRYNSGTSFAAPLVAGGAALALEHDPSLTAEDLRDFIRSTGSRAANPDIDYGFGLYSATRAARIAALDIERSYVISVGQTREIELAVVGTSDSVPAFYGVNLPLGVEVVDMGGGVGWLNMRGMTENVGEVAFGVAVDVGYFVDTTSIQLITRELTDKSVTLGPNPFRDSLTIFLNGHAGSFKSVSVFNIAGEKVWEALNVSPQATELQWYGRNSAGQPAAAGAYVVFVRTDRRTERLKVLKLD
ncbi:MAG: S8 family serine peptidase [candidate division Zixibacteria bacterium]|nr:S8 family serine peptidase [candidate division Zixibacteria bacterium]